MKRYKVSDGKIYNAQKKKNKSEDARNFLIKLRESQRRRKDQRQRLNGDSWEEVADAPEV